MNIQVLESFICLYREKNMSRAGAKLFISQQGLSRQIQSLENEWGVPMFIRSKSGLEPTDICHKIYPSIERIFDEYLKVEREINVYRNRIEERYTIAFAYGVSNSVSSDFMFDYQKLHPEIHLEIEEWSQEICLDKLQKGELDGAFLISPDCLTDVNATMLIKGEMYIAMHKSHPLAVKDTPLEFKDIDGENIITGVPENAVRRLMDYFCRKYGVNLKVLVSSSNNLNYINSLTSNIGIGPITQTMAARVTNPDIVLRPVNTPEDGFLFYCTPLSAAMDKALSEIKRYIECYFRDTPVDNILKTT